MTNHQKPKIPGEESRPPPEEQPGRENRLPPQDTGEDEAWKLLHELQVHQLELELQNQELNKARQDAEELLDKYTDLFDYSPVSYVILDPLGTILRINLTGAGLLSLERAKLIGRRFTDFVAASSRSDFVGFLQKTFSSPAKEECELSLQNNRDIQFFVQIEALAAASKQECRMALIDVTELKRARQDLLRAEKLESLGVLAGGIAHDFNNLLTAILGHVSLLRIQRPNPEQTVLRLTDIENVTLQAKDLAMQLLTFARGGEPVKNVLSLNRLLQEMAGLAASGSGVRCEFDLADDLWPVEADRGQINQVVHNLVLNAVQAMPNGGRITIVAQNSGTPLEGKRHIRVTIADTGTGIAEDSLQKIFEPYFTTKKTGNGLGLAICFSIIRKHGGRLSVSSTPGQGSVFTLDLPAASEPDRVPENTSREEIHSGSGRILLMDDQASIRDIGQQMLEELGYQAECVENGREAVDRYRKMLAEGTPFAAVILDLTVPGGMGGQEAIALIRRIAPEARAIVSSGYADDPVMAHYQSCGFNAVLRKPYRLEDLSRALKDLLRSGN